MKSEIASIADVTCSVIKALDIFYVLKGAKEAARVFASPGMQELVKSNGLFYETSDFKVMLRNDASRCFSDSGVRNMEKGESVLYIARSGEKALEAKEAEDRNDNNKLGEILGYPECCRSFFSENIEKSKSSDLTVQSWKNSSSFYAGINTSMRCFDACLISHFPCSFGCEDSRLIADRNKKVIGASDATLLNSIEAALKGIVIYSEGIGVYKIRKYVAGNGIIEYTPEDIEPSCINDFYSLLKKGRIVILGRNRFLIGGVEVNDAHTFMAEFL